MRQVPVCLCTPSERFHELKVELGKAGSMEVNFCHMWSIRTGVTARTRRRGTAHAVWENRLIDTGVFYSIAADFIALVWAVLHNKDVKAKFCKKKKKFKLDN